jgi:hypothetical protein
LRALILKLAAVTGLCLALAGCAQPRADNDADRMGRTTIDAVQRNDWITLDKNLGKAMAEDPDHAPKIVKIQANFPAEPPWSIKLITSARAKAKDQPERATLNYLYTFANRQLVIDLAVEQDGWRRVYEPVPLRPGQVAPKLAEPPVEKDEPPKAKPDQRPYKVAKVFKLVSIAVTPVDQAQVAANRFFSPGKPARQWGFLIATFAIPALMVAAAIATLRAKGLRHKWLWVLISFVGVGAVWMNWATGAWGAVWAVNLLGFGLAKGPSPLSPWILHFAPPVGALVVAIRLALHRPGKA